MAQAPHIFTSARTQLDQLALGQVSAAELLEEHIERSGGVLGHQVGGGRGKDLATAGGAVAGAAIGANSGRGTGESYDRDVRRCAG